MKDKKWKANLNTYRPMRVAAMHLSTAEALGIKTYTHTIFTEDFGIVLVFEPNDEVPYIDPSVPLDVLMPHDYDVKVGDDTIHVRDTKRVPRTPEEGVGPDLLAATHEDVVEKLDDIANALSRIADSVNEINLLGVGHG